MTRPTDASPQMLADDDAGLASAAAIVAAGGLVAVPTETVYGLAADATNPDAVASIYRAKGRPDFNPLIVHVADRRQAEALALFDEDAAALADAFWPGPLTLVLPLRPDSRLARAVTAGLGTVALRVPAHPVMQRLLGAVGQPLAAPSANRSGGISPTRAAHVLASFGAASPAVIDGGACPTGIESTIVAVGTSAGGGWRLLRPGPVTPAMLRAVAAEARGDAEPAGRIEAPGQLASHYAPTKPLRLNAAAWRADDFGIGFGAIIGDVSLSPSGNLAEAAARLFEALHQADASDRPMIAIAPVPDEGIGAAINDRLRRAAAPRI